MSHIASQLSPKQYTAFFDFHVIIFLIYILLSQAVRYFIQPAGRKSICGKRLSEAERLEGICSLCADAPIPFAVTEAGLLP